MDSSSYTTYDPNLRIFHAFNVDGESDLVIRTEGGDFQVHKWPLKTSSPFFKDLLSLSQNGVPDAERDIVEVPDSWKTVRHILSAIYQRHESDFSTVEDLTEFTHAAIKYEIPPAISKAKAGMRQFISRGKSPLHIYALARKFRFDLVASKAVRACVLLPLPNAALFDGPITRSLPMEDYLRLIFYKSQRADRACELVLKNVTFTSWCRECRRFGCRWFQELALMLMLRLKERPSSEVLLDKGLIDSCLQTRCSGEPATFAESEAFFVVTKAEIDALPWEYHLSTAFTCPLQTDTATYSDFKEALQGTLKANNINLRQSAELEMSPEPEDDETVWM